jgi:hypothetical protein
MKHSIKYIGQVPSKWSSGNNVFYFLVSIGDEIFDYYTGLGHAKNAVQAKKFGMPLVPNIPEIDDVLECLFSDASCAQGSFDEFCSEFGYDTDSRKALETYLSCQNSGQRLRKALGKEFESTKQRIEAKND